MTFLLELGAPTLALPYALLSLPQQRINPPQTTLSHLAQATTVLAQIENSPNYITVLNSTPSYLYLAAAMRWPNAIFLAEEESAWLELPSGEYWPADNTVAETVTSPPQTNPSTADAPITLTEKISPPNTQTIPSSASTVTSEHAKEPPRLSDKYILSKIFEISSWGEDQPENLAQIEAYTSELLRRSERNPNLLLKAKRQRDLGGQAHNKWIDCERRLKSGGCTPVFMTWFEQQIQNTDAKITYYLQQKLKRELAWREKKQQQYRNATVCNLPILHLNGQHHPNSLRHLPVHHHWHILIDETGSEFDNSKDLPISDKTLGRMVALAIPVNKVKLPLLAANFHATSQTDANLDKTMQVILNNPVGIIGITVKDALLGKGSRWFSGIYALMRLVLRLLPLQGQGKVEFFIEQRSNFNATISLLPVQQLLEAELHGLDKERFKNISLELQFSNKQHHPANGYVDMLAHTWTASANSKKRLKNAALLGHCLLEPQHEVIERGYATLDNVHTLSTKDWYYLVAALANEPQSSLLHNVMQQLGQQTQHKLAVWNSYLNAVRLRLKHKDYHLNELKSALDWLAQYAPAQQKLPPMLQLHWFMARLACANHLGQNDIALLSESLTLGQSLIEENAVEVCHLHLRIAVAATNQFEFDAAQQILSVWHDQTPRVIGLNNYGKYLSSLGQLAAFKGNLQQAVSYFEQAIAVFDKLSEPQEKQKQQQQTHIYRLIALMDMPTVSDQTLRQHLEQFWHCTLDKAAQQLSASDDNRRFEQHLLLRAMICRPSLQQKAYLDHADNWQYEESHPWPLIAAYRAMLLQPSQPQKAALWLHKALEYCYDAQGSTLNWMAEVLATWSKQLGFNSTTLSKQERDVLHSKLPHAPWAALNTLGQAKNANDTEKAFNACLPFNFH